MSRERALAAIRGEFSDRMPIWDWPDSPPLAEHLFDYDIWEDPYRAALDLWTHFDIDFSVNIPGDFAEWNFPLVRINGNADILEDPSCDGYRRAFKPGSIEAYKSLYDICGMKSRAGYWGMAPTLANSRFAVSSPEEVLQFNPLEHDTYTLQDRIDFFRYIYPKRQEEIGEASMYSGWYYCTLFMWLVEVFGYENFMVAAYMDPSRFKEIILQFWELTKRDIEAMCHVEDLPIIGLHDDVCDVNGPLFAPEWLREFIFPYYHDLFDIIHDFGKKVFFCSDGNLNKVISDIRAFDVDGLACDHNNHLKDILDAFPGKIIFGGAIDPTVILTGSNEDVEHMVKETIKLARHEPGYFFSSGAVNGSVPVERALFYYETYQKHAKR